MDALLKDLNGESFEKYTVVKICISHIHPLLEKIKEEIETINLKIVDQHYSKYYFYNWNATDYETNISNLKKYKLLLNKRADTLIKILPFVKK